MGTPNKRTIPVKDAAEYREMWPARPDSDDRQIRCPAMYGGDNCSRVRNHEGPHVNYDWSRTGGDGTKAQPVHYWVHGEA